MKKLLIYIGCASALFAGCTKDFDAINTNPVATTADVLNPNFLLSQSQAEAVQSIAGYQGAYLFQNGWVQITASTSSGSANYHSNNDKYVESSNTLVYQASTWGSAYRAASIAYEMKLLTDGKPEYSNLNAVATITKVIALHNVTDIYGDIPYTEALKGKEDGTTLPKYDPQQTVYTTMLTDLETAITQLDPAKDKPSSDQFYKGDIAKWKKLGYSLMLKLAMRLTKADATLAKTWAEKAYAGGTFSSNADNAFFQASNAAGYGNSNANAMRVTDDLYQVRWSKTLIDWLKVKDDPRLSAIAEVPQAGLSGNTNLAPGDNTASAQKGLPNGFDLNGGATDVSNSPGYTGGTGTGGDFTKLGLYSRPRGFYRNQDGPMFVLTYAQTELLLAEASARGWNTGSAATHYANGVTAAITSLSTFGSDATISAGAAATYLAANPYDNSTLENSLKQINEQIWVLLGSHLQFVEAWTNWRRSGYPVLTPVNYIGNFSGGAIPRRQPYPGSEPSLNPENYASAVAGLNGGDVWTARVWWDK